MIETILPPDTARHAPTAARLPLAGGLPYIIRRPFGYLSDAWRQYGDVFRVDLGVIEAVVLSNPRHAQYVLRDNARNYRKGGNMWTSVRTLFGNGLVGAQLEDDKFERLSVAMPHALYYLIVGIVGESLPSWTPLPGKRRYLAARETFDEIVYRVIARHRAGAAAVVDDLAAERRRSRRSGAPSRPPAARNMEPRMARI